MPTRDEMLAKARAYSDEALRLHPLYRGKMQALPKCAVRGFDDFAIWYSPGVAAPCKEIARDPERVFEHTGRGNTIAIVSDGSRTLGLGNIGARAALPVMEGKALLFKYLGGVDAVPLCIAPQEPFEIVRFVKAIEPTFGGINLEDIAQPKCFAILDTLRREMDVPVWHDDQQGTAAVTLAALYGALEVVGKRIDRVRIAMIGMGAANVAVYRLLTASGVDPKAIVACDSDGTLHRDRQDVAAQRAEYADKWRVCVESNGDDVRGSIADAMRGADVCIALAGSGPIVKPEWVAHMARRSIVFACGNPVPEIWPWDAKEAGAEIVCTGRCDMPNQVNNSLGFPGIFRGVLDVRARRVTDEMAIAASAALAAYARERGLGPESILPKMDDVEVALRQAVAVGMKAQEQGVARLRKSPDELRADALAKIRDARAATALLMKEKLIAMP